MKKETGSELVDRISQSRLLLILSFLGAAAVVVTAVRASGASTVSLSTSELAMGIVVAVLAGVLFLFSLYSVLVYIFLVPRYRREIDLMTAIHGSQLAHPLLTSIVLGLLAVCILLGNNVMWIAFGGLLVVFFLHTGVILIKIRREELATASACPISGRSVLYQLFQLVIGGEMITLAGGAKSISPRRLGDLPESTWIIDVRTKVEYKWAHLNSAESFPFGAGVVAAAHKRPKDTPVLVICLSGHRSPAVAAVLKRLGFESVYNLNWGMVYLMMTHRNNDNTDGPFGIVQLLPR